MNFQKAQQYLNSFINREIHLGWTKSASFKLERVRHLLKELGNPQKGLKIIHVAGSKAKGSICSLTASILQHAGYRVGLYTSPHINNYRERIRVLPKPTCAVGLGLGEDIFPDMISEEELCAILEEIKPAVEKVRAEKGWGALSFFEVYTALALYHFHKQNVDFAVLETGVGGRLDATNAADSLVAVIAPVSLEHTHILGKTVARIAREKAAIIKDRGQKVVIAPQDNRAREVFKKRCREFDIKPVWVEDDIKCEEITQDHERQTFTLTTPKAAYGRLVMPLLGRHQRENAAAAVSITECLQDLGFAIPPDAVREGLKNVFWPCRFEIIQRDPLVILDGAHNKASAKVLAETVKAMFGDRKVILVLGICVDKDKKSICEELEKIAGNIIFTKADHPRAGDLPGAVGVEQALDLAFRKADKEDIVLVTGSIFVAAEARAIIASHINSKSQAPNGSTGSPSFVEPS